MKLECGPWLVFEWLKTALHETLILKLPDFTKPFVVEADASDQAVGTVLL